eukprot:1796975-Ditylum_brightwellii.AAC.2
MDAAAAFLAAQGIDPSGEGGGAKKDNKKKKKKKKGGGGGGDDKPAADSKVRGVGSGHGLFGGNLYSLIGYIEFCILYYVRNRVLSDGCKGYEYFFRTSLYVCLYVHTYVHRFFAWFLSILPVVCGGWVPLGMAAMT